MREFWVLIVLAVLGARVSGAPGNDQFSQRLDLGNAATLNVRVSTLVQMM